MGMPPTSRHVCLSPKAIPNAFVASETQIVLQFANPEYRKAFERLLLNRGIPLWDLSKPSSILDYQIPREVMLLIFELLSFRDLKSVSEVSREWRLLCNTKQLGLKQYIQLVKTVIPDVPTSVELSRSYKRRFLDMNVYGVTFIEGFTKPLNIVKSIEPLPTPTALYQHSQLEAFDPQTVKFPSGQIEKGELFQESDFCIQEYYRVEKDHDDYYMENTGVIAIVKEKSLTEQQIKLIYEIQNSSPSLMREKIEKKARNTLSQVPPRETRSSKKRKISHLTS